MIRIITDPFFTYFIVTLLSTGFSIFVKSVSRSDLQVPLRKEDFAIGLELSVTALIMFITDSVTYSTTLINNPSSTLQEEKIIIIPWIIFSFILGIWSISTLIRKSGWSYNSEGEMNWLNGIIIPNIFGLLSLIFVVNWIID